MTNNPIMMDDGQFHPSEEFERLALHELSIASDELPFAQQVVYDELKENLLSDLEIQQLAEAVNAAKKARARFLTKYGG